MALALSLKLESLALALALKLESLALALALKVKSFGLGLELEARVLGLSLEQKSLALKLESLALALKVKSLLTTLIVGSVEELADLKSAYESAEGDMERVLVELRCCTLADIERLCQIIQRLVDTRQISRYKQFTRTAAIVRRRAAAGQTQVQNLWWDSNPDLAIVSRAR